MNEVGCEWVFVQWGFVLWGFVSMGFSPVGFCPYTRILRYRFEKLVLYNMELGNFHSWPNEQIIAWTQALRHTHTHKQTHTHTHTHAHTCVHEYSIVTILKM